MEEKERSVKQIKDFLASSEMSYDPMYQPSMDSMYHAYLSGYEKQVVNGKQQWKKRGE